MAGSRYVDGRRTVRLTRWLAAAVLGGWLGGCIGGALTGGNGADANGSAADASGDAAAGDAGNGIDSASGPDGTIAGACTSLGAWSSTAEFADADHVSHPLPSFAVGSYYYVHTQTPGGDDRVLYSAAQQPDGSLGAWQVASSDHGGGPHGFAAIAVGGEAFHFRNGHIARYPLDASGIMTGDVELLEDSVDTSFGGNRYVWDTAVHAAFGGGNDYVFHLGGFSFTGYAYRQDVFRSAVPLASQFEDVGVDHPADRPGKSAFVAPAGAEHGYIFTGESGGSRLWRARVASGGGLETWVEQSSLPAGTGNERGELFAVDSTLFAVRGARVFAAHVDEGGTLGPFAAMPDLPEDEVDISWGDGHLEGNAWGIIGEHVYVTGPKRVFYAPIARGQPCP